MAYVKTTWVNHETKVNAENMNHIEEGIEEASQSGTKLYIHSLSAGGFVGSFYVVSTRATPYNSSLSDLYINNVGVNDTVIKSVVHGPTSLYMVVNKAGPVLYGFSAVGEVVQLTIPTSGWSDTVTAL